MSKNAVSKRESLSFELLHILENEAGLSQREIADRLGVSLGRVNYYLRSLFENGSIDITNFRTSDNKLRYAYVVSPKGVAEKSVLTAGYLQRKLTEFARLKSQIEELQRGTAATIERSAKG